ncbi:MAG: helix-hairpin-helix domain-containing protein [Candidatus Margulisiibacteriota bacterium]
MRLSKEQTFTIIGLCLAIVVGGGIYLHKQISNRLQPELTIKEAPVAAAPSIVVHICGRVKSPGVFKIKHGDRIMDVIELAGGAVPGADLELLNLAEKVKDGQKIVVPAKAAARKGQAGAGGRVNINSADQKELETLPSIGPSTAKRIIESRPYSSPEDLMKVPRIGKKTFEKLKDKISI